MRRLTDLIIARPRTSLAAIFCAALVVGSGTFFLRIDFSPEQVYAGQDDAVEFCEQHRQQFRFEDSILLVLLEATDDRSLVRGDCVAWMKQFSERAEQISSVESVTSLATLKVPRISLRGESRLTWQPLFVDDDSGDTEYLEQRLQKIPLLNDTLISKDRQLMMTLIELDPADRTINGAWNGFSAVEKLLSESQLPNQTRTFVTGVPAIRVDVVRSLMDDQMTMTPICSVLFLVASLIMFRSWLVTALCLFGVLTAVLLTVGLTGWFGGTFSIMSNVIPSLVLIIGSANNVHILSRFQMEMRHTNDDVVTCVRRTIGEMSRTCFLTLATTAIGFGSLLIAHASVLQSLAVQAATGMGCCYVSLMLVSPAMLVLCARKLSPQRSASGDVQPGAVVASGPKTQATESVTTGGWQSLGSFVRRHAAVIVVLHVCLAGWTLWSCRNVPINSYMFETFDGDHPTLQAVHKMNQRMSGLVSLEIQLSAPNRNRFFDGDVAAALAVARQRISADPRVSFYRDYVEFLAVFDHGRAVSDDPDEAAASLRRVRLVLKQLDDPALTSQFLGDQKPIARVMMRIHDAGSLGMKALFGVVEQVLDEELPDDVYYRLTGDAYLHAVCMDVFVRDMFYSLIAASGIIFLLITLLFRSLTIGLISTIPNMFPLVMTLGYIKLRGYELTAGNVVVFTISLGIAVDDTIHFLARFRDERKKYSLDDAVRQSLVTSGRAILLTSLLVVSGLSVLIFSDFVPTQRFAELTAITMCSALPGDLVLLPALLTLARRRTNGGRPSVTETS